MDSQRSRRMIVLFRGICSSVRMKSREPLRAQGLPCSATSHFARHQLAVRDGIDEGLVDYIEIMSTRRESGASAASRATYAGVCKPRSQLCLNTARHAYSTLSTSSHEEEKEDGSATGEEKTPAQERMEAARRRAEQAGPSGDGAEGDDGTSEDASGELERLRHRLLKASMEHVHHHGWTNSAIVAGARDIGLSPAVSGILTNGEGDLVAYFVDRCNGELADRLAEMQDDLREMRVRDRIKTAVRIRLELTLPYINSWSQALGIMAQPQNVPVALRQLAMMVDDIWQHAGDASTDHNWYTKRAILAGVYTATELYMLTDTSPGKAETWDALERRLEDSMVLGKTLGRVGAQFAPLMSGIADQITALLKGTRMPKPPSGPMV